MNKAPSLQELLERDKDVIEQLQKKRKSSAIEPEWVLLAEFGLHFGWEAVRDAREDKISFAEMNKLLAASRALKAAERYNVILDIYTANAAVHDKKGATALKETLRDLKNKWQQTQ